MTDGALLLKAKSIATSAGNTGLLPGVVKFSVIFFLSFSSNFHVENLYKIKKMLASVKVAYSMS